MPYTFRMVFSGPCAYVPNLMEGDAGPARSWSVLLPDLRRGWGGHDDKVPADRHLPVLQYHPDAFASDTDPDTALAVKDLNGGPQYSNLFFLDGHRITLDLPGAAALMVEEVAIDTDVRGDQDRVLELLRGNSPLLRSMDWLPAMSWLRQDLQWFGASNTSYFRADGYPEPGILAAHVLLTKGALITHEIDTIPTQDRGEVPTIWEFMPRGAAQGSGPRYQALAKSIALEASGLEEPVSITIAFDAGRKITLTLKKDKLEGLQSVEVKSRELEEIFLLGGYELERQQVDMDFRYMYSHAANYDRTLLNYPLPHLLRGAGAGNEVGTCGGNKFSGFASSFYETVQNW